MSDTPYRQNRDKQAAYILRSAQRLVAMLEAQAPEFLIEQARQILLRRITEFPVNGDMQKLALEERDRRQTEIDAHLDATGFGRDQAEDH